MRTNTATTRPITGRSRPRTTATSFANGGNVNNIICAIAESKGISPSIGLAFVNLTTCEAVLCQFTDTQTFARTCHKLKVFGPNEIIYASTAATSKLVGIVQENVESESNSIAMTQIDRKYWSEHTGHEYVTRLAFPADLEALRMSLAGNYFAVCCFAAALRFIELRLGLTFAAEALRIKFESSEGAMMLDVSTIASLELVQNLQDPNSRHCLFGVLNQTDTRMGARLLKNNILQPSTDQTKIEKRWQAVNELCSREEMFHTIKNVLKQIVDTDKTLADLILIPKKLDLSHMEHSVNNVLMLKTFVSSIKPIWQAMNGVMSEELQKIRDICNSENYLEIEELIQYALSEDVFHSRKAEDLRNHRIFALRAGTNGFLDVARTSYNEFLSDAKELVEQLQAQHEIPLELKYDTVRQFCIQIKIADIDANRPLPEILVNVVRKSKKIMECQTLDLIKYNQKIKDVHNEIMAMSDASIQSLIAQVRTQISPLFKVSEAIALLDLLTSFAHNATTYSYTRPEVSINTLAVAAARHPIRALIQKEKFIPNDIYATRENKRFQIITGCNMSGKSTYIRSVALLTIMAQIGSFVPAQYASFPIIEQLFARISTDDCMEANVSTFASEMREMAFIFRNLSSASLIIVDELGRGTSTTDGLSIAIAMSEALIQSKAIVYFVTHFRELPIILNERVGVYNMHMDVDIDPDFSRMRMRYKVSDGCERQKFYGLALAQLVDLPDEVMEVAVATSKTLNAQSEAKKTNEKLLALAKKRKLAVHMRETLLQAREGPLEGKELLQRMQRLQREFLVRMAAIDAELATACNTIKTPCQVARSMLSSQGNDAVFDDLRSEPTNKQGTEHNTEMSWEASLNHQNPLFRPMPTENQTQTPHRGTTFKSQPLSGPASARQDREEADMLAADISWLAEKGDSFDDPISIEDDGTSLPD